MIHDIPGSEVPRGIYRVALFSFIWMLFAAWVAFGHARGTDVDLVFVTIIVAMISMLPTLVRRTARRHQAEFDIAPSGGDAGEFETATGKLANGEAYLQIVLIPAALAVAATVFSLIYLLAS